MKSLCVSWVALLSASFVSVIAAHGDETQRELNGGYYLLHKLCENEAQLPLLLDIKHTPPEIKKFADRISQTSKATNASIEDMQDRDPKLRFDQNPLPSIERDIRESIQDQKQHQLLFGTSNDAFVRVLLVDQIEACGYALNIAKVLSQKESDQRRVKVLNEISANWLALNDECFHRLNAMH